MNKSFAPRDLHSLVSLLVLLQLLSVFFLWTLNPVSQTAERAFAIFLAVDLVSFSVISYIYRVDKRKDKVNASLLLLGSCMILALMVAILFIR